MCGWARLEFGLEGSGSRFHVLTCRSRGTNESRRMSPGSSPWPPCSEEMSAALGRRAPRLSLPRCSCTVETLVSIRKLAQAGMSFDRPCQVDEACVVKALPHPEANVVRPRRWIQSADPSVVRNKHVLQRVLKSKLLVLGATPHAVIPARSHKTTSLGQKRTIDL
eukprot:1537382-Rhodomonas_salina.1